MKEFWLTLIQNDKAMAMIIIGTICIFAMFKITDNVKDIIIPAITGIGGFVTGTVYAATKTNGGDQPK